MKKSKLYVLGMVLLWGAAIAGAIMLTLHFLEEGGLL